MLETQIYEKSNIGGQNDLITFLANMTSSSRDVTGNGKVFVKKYLASQF